MTSWVCADVLEPMIADQFMDNNHLRFAEWDAE